MDRLTPGQERELLLMHKEPQLTYGRGRTRVQNALVRLGLAEYFSVREGGSWADKCQLTQAGRDLACEVLARKTRR